VAAATPLTGVTVETESTTAEAAAYDRWFETAWGRYAFGVEGRAILAALGPLRSQRLLDVGCGTGRFTALAEAQGAVATGLDLDSGMLAVARTRLHGRLLQADAQALPFSDRSFDVVMAITLLEFLSDADKAVAEMARVAAPGGKLVVGSLHPTSPWGLAHRARLRHPPWSGAVFVSRRRMIEIGHRYGRALVRAALYAPGALPALPVIGPLIEFAGRPFPALGAFQILTVDLAKR
jgi:SAM-dependent methyltransferase